ncbi:MAG: hypothetical protein ACI4Q0_07820 [Oligosphaeraceae bacterium]
MGFHFFGHREKADLPGLQNLPTSMTGNIALPEDQRAQLASDLSMLDKTDTGRSLRLQKDVERSVISAAEDSVKRLRVVEMGRCPSCGAHIYQHVGANICDACGWHQFDLPKKGAVRVHLKGGAEAPLEGERAYVLKSGDCLVVRNGVVAAQVPRDAYTWVEYNWPQEELASRHTEAQKQLTVPCGWCGKHTNPTADGFHLLHIAFGATQERYCFCSDECYEAFRKMYPSRVHRDCYNRDCATCNACQKRYDEEAAEMRMLAKDYIRAKREG